MALLMINRGEGFTEGFAVFIVKQLTSQTFLGKPAGLYQLLNIGITNVQSCLLQQHGSITPKV